MTIPRWAEAILRLMAAPGRAEDAIGDLNEVHARRVVAHGRLVATLRTTLSVVDMAASLARERRRARFAGRRGVLPVSAGVLRLTLEAWRRDLALACRSLWRARGFTAVTVLTLSTAIGANTAVFSVVEAVLLDPLPFPEPDRLVTIRGSAPGLGLPGEFDPAVEFYVQYREGASLLEDLGIYRSGQTTVRAGDHLDRLFGVQATPDLFRTLGAVPQIGRFPAADDAGRTVVISDPLWQEWFGADPGVIGRSIEVAGELRRVIGVAQPSFRFPNGRIAFWLDHPVGDPNEIRPGTTGFRFVGRTKPDTELDDLTGQLTALASRLPEQFGGPARYLEIIEHHRAVVRPLAEDLVGGFSGPLWLVFGTVGIVLLVACANVANLFSVRASGRRRDLAVRRALGAGQRDLIRQQMAEALALSTLGGLGGVLLARAALPILLRMAPDDIPNLDATALDSTALAFTACVSLLTALVFGVLPAIRASRPEAVSLRRRSAASRRVSTRHVLVLLQTASALVLLVGSGLLVRSFWTLNRVDAGYDTDGILTFQIAPERDDLVDGPTLARFHDELMERVANLPGVESVGLSDLIPLDGGASRGTFHTESSLTGGREPPLVRFTYVGGEYFRTMGIGLRSGRLLARSDHVHDGATPVVVSTAAAERLWPGEEAIGKGIAKASDTTEWLTVVGVVEDVLLNDFRQEAPDPMLYLPLVGPDPQSWVVRSPAYVVRSSRAERLAPEIRALVREHVPESPVYRMSTMRELAGRSMAWLSFTMLMLAVASGVALILGTVGLYGVLSYVVANRSREIAVRMALGARASGVRRMVVAQGTWVTAQGVALGLILSLASTRVLDSLLFGVQALDAVTFASMASLMLAVAALASYLPSRTASSVDPMQSLRSD